MLRLYLHSAVISFISCRSIAATLLLCLLAASAVGWLYQPATRFAFLEYDDNLYVTRNVEVLKGFAPGVLARAWRTNLAGNWQPLTFLSHAGDVQAFGLDAGRHHLVAILWHAANAVLLLLLARLLGLAPVASWILAVLFAVHPLRIESVAWIAERKDLISTFFFLLTLMAYTAWTRRGSGWLYVAALAFFVLGLMSKVMLVTLPFVLLLLDWWPLRRTEPPVSLRWRMLVWEKWPFFAISGAFCVVAVVAQQQAGAVRDLAMFPLGVRAQTVPIAYVAYLGKCLWPFDLAPFYHHPLSWSLWQVCGATALLILLSVLLWILRCSRPWWLAGWLWYLGTLVPVIGLVQVGDQWLAARYTYIPMIGPLAALVIEGYKFARRSRRAMIVASVAALAAIAALSWVTSRILPVWRNNSSLGEAGTRGGKRSWAMCSLQAIGLRDAGRVDEAITALEAIRRNYPRNPKAANNLGYTLLTAGRKGPALVAFQQAIALDPHNQAARTNLGKTLLLLGRRDEALAQFEALMAASTNDPDVYVYAAQACLDSDPERALKLARKASELSPGPNFLALDMAGMAQAVTGHHAEAAQTLRQAAQVARQAGYPEIAKKFEERAKGWQP